MQLERKIAVFNMLDSTERIIDGYVIEGIYTSKATIFR